MQEARAKADAVVARAAAEDAAADAKSDAATSDDVLLTWSEQEEAHAVAALRISAEERVLELTEQLEESRRRSVSPAALKRVSRELLELRRVLYTGPHTTAFAWLTPILKDFSRRISPPTPRFQSSPSTPFNSN